MCKSYRPCLPRTCPRAASRCGGPSMRAKRSAGYGNCTSPRKACQRQPSEVVHAYGKPRVRNRGLRDAQVTSPINMGIPKRLRVVSPGRSSRRRSGRCPPVFLCAGARWHLFCRVVSAIGGGGVPGFVSGRGSGRPGEAGLAHQRGAVQARRRGVGILAPAVPAGVRMRPAWRARRVLQQYVALGRETPSVWQVKKENVCALASRT